MALIQRNDDIDMEDLSAALRWRLVDQAMIVPIISLNQRGYHTISCCQGHVESANGVRGNAYIVFVGEPIPKPKMLATDGWMTENAEIAICDKGLRITTLDCSTLIYKGADHEHAFTELRCWIDSLPKRAPAWTKTHVGMVVLKDWSPPIMRGTND
ncbi:MAG: hypothetical protein GYA24_07065 [Candidatus Lokiarchaeota archaeon]|nr:hypothetical protein [Candidatus Lokiarchaeota archaeon]